MTQRKSEVTGLVLSIGEPTTARAIESLRAQTFPCKDIVLIENVSPFHAAMNAGIARISTPFFIQCDADMIADPDCIETMLKFVRNDTGVIIGYLEDALLGQVQAPPVGLQDPDTHAPASTPILNRSASSLPVALG